MVLDSLHPPYGNPDIPIISLLTEGEAEFGQAQRKSRTCKTDVVVVGACKP